MKIDGLLLKKDIISASSTALIWLILLVLALTIQPEKEPRYEVIQLIFEEDIPEKVIEPIPEPVAEPIIEPVIEEIKQNPQPQEIKEVSSEKIDAPKTVEPVEKKEKEAPAPISKPVPSPVAKPSPAAAAAPVEKRVEPKLVQSMEELMAQNTKPAAKEVVWDDSIFETSAVEQESESVPIVNTNQNEPVQALSGTAASAQKESSAVSSVQTSRSAASTSAMSSTEAALQNILSAKPGVYTSQGTEIGKSFETQSSSKSDTDGVSMDLADGSTRRLLHPSKPAIVLSAESERLITSSRTVTIIFAVLANGTVPPGNISFQPSAALPVAVQTEIRAQIALWRFEEEKSDGQARLTYSINVK